MWFKGRRGGSCNKILHFRLDFSFVHIVTAIKLVDSGNNSLAPLALTLAGLLGGVEGCVCGGGGGMTADRTATVNCTVADLKLRSISIRSRIALERLPTT